MNYKTTLKFHLPNDPPWRDKPVDKTDIVKADNPEELWRKVIVALTNHLGMSQDLNLFTGILLNLINPFPEEFRQGIVDGIRNGYGLTIEKDPESDRLKGVVKNDFPTLTPAATVPGADAEDANVIRRPSGLVVPR